MLDPVLILFVVIQHPFVFTFSCLFPVLTELVLRPSLQVFLSLGNLFKFFLDTKPKFIFYFLSLFFLELKNATEQSKTSHCS